MTTTIVPEEGPPQVINARRTESLDSPDILNLVENSTNDLFGRVNVVDLIEKAVLAVTLSNDKEEVMAHAAFFDYPNAKDCQAADWEVWANCFYDFTSVSPLNCLFMHYFVARKEYAQGCAKEIIRTAFNAIPDLHYIFLVVPNGVYPEPCLGKLFTQMEKKEGVFGPEGSVLFSCERHQHLPVLHIRPARVEDHDDLTPIFNRHSDMLKMTYGDFFLAELIESQDEHMKCLVAEVSGVAIGFMSISDDVNFNLLNECFELGPFNGLKKPNSSDMLTPPIDTPPLSPAPQISAHDERPVSKESQKSSQSKSSEQLASGKEDTRLSDDKAPKPSRSSSNRSSRAGSTSEDDTKVKPRLSDSQMGSSSNSLLSQKSVADAVQDAIEQQDRETSQPVVNAPVSRFTTPKPATPAMKLPKRFVPKYFGEDNAFCIQLFCIDERYEMRSCDFLTKAFSVFPDRDFSIITVPHLVPEFPLLQAFARVTPRCPSILAQELYLFSRYGLMKNVNVRRAFGSDYNNIENLVSSIDLHENLMKDLELFNKARRDEDGTEVQAFIAECQQQIVGVAVVRREEDIEYIRAHYNIEDFIYFNHHKRSEHGHLHHFALNPVFKHLSKHFIKEILRIGNKTCLYYPLYPSYSSNEVVEKHSLVDCLNDMVPVRMRRQIAYPEEKLGVNAPSQRILKEQPSYAMYHINRKLVQEPKVVINARIVVVGASDVGMSFLECLAYCPHLHFNNVTVVSPHGLPGELPPDDLRDNMISSSHCYSHEEYAKMALRTWTNAVYGRMTSIDRKKKHVIVNGNTHVPYDHLVICTGEQYQIPNPGRDAETYSGVVPKNLFIINDSYDAAVALYWVENRIMKGDRKVIVYGDTLDSFCCVQTLLSMGVPGSNIQFVKPQLKYNIDAFHDYPAVSIAVDAALKEAGVVLHYGCDLVDWNDGGDVSELYSATFTTEQKKDVKLECDAFFAFSKKGTDLSAFKALNDACLVYDGKLVIDSAFHTNDVSIRAAGSLTKFQRKYHAEDWTHALFNSTEVGIALAAEMLKLFDPTVEPQKQPEKEDLNLIPIYKAPKVQGAILPGGYRYLCVHKPGHLPSKDGSDPDLGRDILTEQGGNIFRIYINEYNSIQTIRCLSKEGFPVSNFICLYGMHERYLNNLMSRFNEGLITDFYSYFMEPWCMAFFHDRFLDFRDEIRELMLNPASADDVTMEQKARKLVDEDVPMNEMQRKQLMNMYKDSIARPAIESRLLNFINYNHYHLPMYAKPGMV